METEKVKTEDHQSYQRLRYIVKKRCGSRAKTPKGILNALHGHYRVIAKGLPADVTKYAVRGKRDREPGHYRAIAIAAKVDVSTMRSVARTSIAARQEIVGAVLKAGVPVERAIKIAERAVGYLRLQESASALWPVALSGDKRTGAVGSYAYSTEWECVLSTMRLILSTRDVIDVAREGVVKEHSVTRRRYPTYRRHGIIAYQCGSAAGDRYLIKIAKYIYHAKYRRLRHAISRAIVAAKRRKAAEKRAAEVNARAASVWVSREDSIKAGHCESGTDRAKELLEKALGAVGEIGAIRGDVLLKLRNFDDFAKRAVSAAISRYDLQVN